MNTKKIAFWSVVIVLILSIVIAIPPASVILLIGFPVYKWLEERKKVKKYEQKYSEIIDVDSAVDTSNTELDKINLKIVELQESYKQKHIIYNDLIDRVAIYDERMNFAEMGMYEPHFDFDTSEAYRDKIKEIRAKQKSMIKEESAITCSTAWEVSGSKAEGQKMTNRAIRLTARAFNNECDAAIANVSWNNAERMEKRIQRAFEAINKMNETNRIYISSYYLDLKLDELRLAFEYKDKRQIEKEDQAELRRQEREEERLKKEVERALAEETKLEKLLAKIQEKASHSEGSELERLQAEITKLGSELKEMQKINDRVKAMAEQTKLGYVYVISNIGSFGKDVYKIGMTRRLEPMDRVKELGNASVPFYFDLHAMIFSEDAPALEAKVQRAFADRRLNLVNYRKEYFNVTLEEIKEKIWEFNPNVEFVDDTEAREFKETLALRHKQELTSINNEIPEEI
ncbi:DUF4041 domain-containing protein [Psychrobacter frigidicola]|uniref:DUF4041 domain-containing protein n=1 Tax=Psychrobacter frigidicola TaxID=45611 RepID=UPI001918152D|nr:DUF4041 domain-containing protein [Psychrobacter frigidicola]